MRFAINHVPIDGRSRFHERYIIKSILFNERVQTQHLKSSFG